MVEAADGVAALEAFEREPPALVILDVNLPRLSGFEVCRRIRADARATPVMMLTVGAPRRTRCRRSTSARTTT